MSRLKIGRRPFLTSGAAAITALSGCSGVFSSTEEGDPQGTSSPGMGQKDTDSDAGRDSYGILLRNETEETYTVNITVKKSSFSDEVYWEKQLDIGPHKKRDWDAVLTKQRGYLVTATSPDIEGVYGEEDLRVQVGEKATPPAKNVEVYFWYLEDKKPTLVVAWPKEYRETRTP